MHVYKFLEPRAWAVEWEGSGLFGTEATGPEAVTTADVRRSLAPQVFPPGTVPESSRNGNHRTWYQRPLGWALRWEGSALTVIEE
jgi:hypothetical protein